MNGQCEVINYQQAPDSTQRNAGAIARLISGETRFEVPDFWITCLDCGYEWKEDGGQWGYPHQCPACGGGNTR